MSNSIWKQLFDSQQVDRETYDDTMMSLLYMSKSVFPRHSRIDDVLVNHTGYFGIKDSSIYANYWKLYVQGSLEHVQQIQNIISKLHKKYNVDDIHSKSKMPGTDFVSACNQGGFALYKIVAPN